jgi:A/G-specific adenine glycosylase
MEKGPSPNQEEFFSSQLLRWHTRNRRDFPWRRTDNPYQILIAEILLQRTKAEQVRSVFEKFIQKFKTAYALAEADVREIEDCIEPLGLRKRGGMLKQLAKELVERHEGEVPRDATALLKLKGVGHYAANAVLCFAYGEDKPIVDWNVARVIKRVWGYPMKPAPHTDKDLFAFASQLIPKGKGREFNLALLDFSAKICKPRNPDCKICFLNEMCNFYQITLGPS